MRSVQAKYQEPSSGERFQIAEALPCIVWIADGDGKTEWFNQEFYRYTGLPPQAPLGHGWITYVHPDDLQSIMREWDYALATGNALASIVRLRSAEGSYRWFKVRARLSRGAEGASAEWFGTLTDVHERQLVVEASTHVIDALMQGYHSKPLPIVEGLAFDTLYQASNTREKLGGDWYDLFDLPDGRIAFSLGDVCGHGVDAAVKMGEAKQAIFVAASLADPAPESVLQYANKVIFLNDHHVSITTALYGIIDTKARTITYAAAGHHPPIVAHASGETTVLPNHGFPLGVENPLPPLIKTHEFTYESGSMMVLYTDGLIEFGHDIFEGEARLLAAAAEALKRKPEHPARFIAKHVLGDVAPDDDIAILTISFEAG